MHATHVHTAQRMTVAPSRQCTVRVRASAQLPKGVTLPKVTPANKIPLFGWVDFAEKLNSRFAMMGFFALLAVEAIANKGLLELMDIKVGNGLGFEF